MNKFLNLFLRLKNLFIRKNSKVKADVAKLVNALGLGSSNFSFESSSLSIRSLNKIRNNLTKIIKLI